MFTACVYNRIIFILFKFSGMHEVKKVDVVNQSIIVYYFMFNGWETV